MCGGLRLNSFDHLCGWCERGEPHKEKDLRKAHSHTNPILRIVPCSVCSVTRLPVLVLHFIPFNADAETRLPAFCSLPLSSSLIEPRRRSSPKPVFKRRVRQLQANSPELSHLNFGPRGTCTLHFSFPCLIAPEMNVLIPDFQTLNGD